MFDALMNDRILQATLLKVDVFEIDNYDSLHYKLVDIGGQELRDFIYGVNKRPTVSLNLKDWMIYSRKIKTKKLEKYKYQTDQSRYVFIASEHFNTKDKFLQLARKMKKVKNLQVYLPRDQEHLLIGEYQATLIKFREQQEELLRLEEINMRLRKQKKKGIPAESAPLKSETSKENGIKEKPSQSTKDCPIVIDDADVIVPKKLYNVNKEDKPVKNNFKLYFRKFQKEGIFAEQELKEKEKEKLIPYNQIQNISDNAKMITVMENHKKKRSEFLHNELGPEHEQLFMPTLQVQNDNQFSENPLLPSKFFHGKPNPVYYRILNQMTKQQENERLHNDMLQQQHISKMVQEREQMMGKRCFRTFASTQELIQARVNDGEEEEVARLMCESSEKKIAKTDKIENQISSRRQIIQIDPTLIQIDATQMQSDVQFLDDEKGSFNQISSIKDEEEGGQQQDQSEAQMATQIIKSNRLEGNEFQEAEDTKKFISYKEYQQKLQIIKNGNAQNQDKTLVQQNSYNLNEMAQRSFQQKKYDENVPLLDLIE